MDAISIVGRIYQITRLIYDQSQQAQVNQAQCRRLADRVKLIEQSIRQLAKVGDSEAFRGSWLHLEKRLNEALTLIRSFSDAKWYQRFFGAQSHDREFAVVNHHLHEAIQQLNLGLSAQQIVNREQDLADQSKDWQALQRDQAKILALQEQALRELHRLPEAHEAILIRQLASLKLNFREVLQRLSPDQKADQKGVHAFDPHYRIRHHELALDELLPAGQFGAMYRGRWQEQPVAIRWLPGHFTLQDEKLFVRAVKLMIRLNHPCLPKFYGACLEERQACAIMEYFPEGDVRSFVTRRNPSPSDRHALALSLLAGLEFLHSKQIVHGNLKSSNVFVTRVDDRWQARISDFHQAQTAYQSLGSAGVARVEWSSPEAKRGDNLSTASDVYQFGLLLGVLCTRPEPFYARWITECCQEDPKRRPQISELCRAFKAYSPIGIAQAVLPMARIAESPVSELVVAKVEIPSARLAGRNPSSESLHQRGMAAEKSGDLKAARQYYQQAADQGSLSGLASLGVILVQDVADPENLCQAFICFQRAAAQGHVRGMFNLAEAYSHGDGIAKDEKLAAHWYRQAADQGYARAECALGICYLKGRGVAKDEMMAVAWLQKSSQKNYGKGTFNLGFCYERGWGVIKDKKRALALYAKANEQGYAQGAARHADLTQSLSSSAASQGIFKASLASDKSPVPSNRYKTPRGEM